MTSELTQDQDITNFIDENNFDPSATLIERRKRLHELATEINQWEDEAASKITTQTQNPPHTPTPIAPPLTFDLINRSTPYYSPKNPNAKSTNASPAHFQQPHSTNKENKTPLANLTNSSNKKTANLKNIVTPSSNEILNVAQRILSKRQSNSSLNEPQSSVKSIKSKFENISVNSTPEDTKNDSLIKMTPKSIIKKFEQMSRDNSSTQLHSSGSLTKKAGSITNIAAKCDTTPLTIKSAASCSNVNTSSSIQLGNVQLKKVKKNLPATNQIQDSPNLDESSIINTDNIKPKSIIEKFESLSKSNGQPSSQEKRDNYKNSHHQTNSCSYSASLTYVSSMQSSISTSPTSESDYEPTPPPPRKANFIDENPVYEEMLNKDSTSLFEDSSSQQEEDEEENDDTQPSSATTTYNTQETHSISGSSYTGSLMNREEFEEGEEEDDYTEGDEEDEYDSITDMDPYDELGNELGDAVETTFSQTTSTSNEMTLKPSPKKYAYSADSSSVPCTSTDIGSSSAESALNQNSTYQSCESSEPLFSIKEYRKQKRNINGGRRSSIMHKNNRDLSLLSNNKNGNAKTTNQIKQTNSNDSTINSDIQLDEQNKKAKYLERIKELEELIKQEDNVIHQTGIALERCITDSQFTGTNEHIECNRILLISCQKRQAYSAEINRLKQLISTFQSHNSTHNNSCLSTDQQSSSSDSSTDISPSDLTGLLIFSDLQLPIKESYINKLKSSDEKRIFYFLCLIRNGIQVLQTQVISVQELIATRDTSLIFPNRMAISNVDINFKVKIDVYTLEVLPKDAKSSKQTSGSHTTSKFFSPFKFHHSNHHSASSSSSSNPSSNSNYGTYSAASNHHFNEQTNLASQGAKTSNFIHVDTIEITQKDILKNKFKLNISSSSIPLTGILYVNVRCMPSKSIELKGFMSLFEDSSASGFGHWDRRWCFLNNFNISYWKYPEDEYRNGPLGVINLTKCVTEKVCILPRDVCARKYSIELLVIEESASSSLNEEPKYKRYRLSADSKDQASDWVTNINFALANLRIWNPKPIKK